MLKHRLLMSAVLIPATVGLFAWDHHLGESAPVLFFLVLLLSSRCVWELVTLTRAVGVQPNTALCQICSWGLLAGSWWHHLPGTIWQREVRPVAFFEETRWHLFGVFGVVSVLLLTNAVSRFPLPDFKRPTLPLDQTNSQNRDANRIGREIGTLGVELFIVVYVGVLVAMTSQLRWTGGALSGYFALGALVVATKMGDVGAYSFGRLIGGPKMTPNLSPGKTWAGGVGHLVTAGLCSVVWLCWLGPKICSAWTTWSVVSACVFGIVVGFAGLIGDLFESLIKRDVGVKDAPALLPGFGGLLDLLDSILLAGPVAYAMWHLLR